MGLDILEAMKILKQFPSRSFFVKYAANDSAQN